MKAADFPAVIVEWLDAVECTLDFEPHTIEHKGTPCRTVGFLIRSDRKGVSIATEVHNDMLRGVQLRTVNFIPRGIVTRVIRLSPSRG